MMLYITYVCVVVFEICSKEAIRLLPAILMLAGLFYISRGFTNRKGVSCITGIFMYMHVYIIDMK